MADEKELSGRYVVCYGLGGGLAESEYPQKIQAAWLEAVERAVLTEDTGIREMPVS